MKWLARLLGLPNRRSSGMYDNDFIEQYQATERAANAAASVDGKHYTEYVEKVKSLKRASRLEEAERLLMRLVAATEAESAITRSGVAPWYYEQLAIVYRKLGRPEDERVILERYARQPKAPGAKPEKLEARLQALGAQKPES